MQQTAFLGAVILAGVLLVGWARRLDSFLGLLVGALLLVRGVGVLAVGEYLQEVRGREFLADDEPHYQQVGEALLSEWQGRVDYEERDFLPIGGGYAHWNAVVIGLWGESSLLPLRLCNVLVAGVIAVITYLIGLQSFAGLTEARLAALAVAASPSLTIWSLTNLKETFLALGAIGAIFGGMMLIRRPALTWAAVWIVSTVFLFFIRRYYGVLLAWLSLIVFLALLRGGIGKRVVTTLLTGMGAGFGVQLIVGTFLGMGVLSETLGRYVVEDGFRVEVERLTFPPDPFVILANLPAVIFPVFEARGDVGQLMALLFFPEGILQFALIPLAGVGFCTALRRGRREVVLPAAWVCMMFLTAAWIYGDPWTIVRFRAVLWPVVLVFAAGGAVGWLRARHRSEGPVAIAAGRQTGQV